MRGEDLAAGEGSGEVEVRVDLIVDRGGAHHRHERRCAQPAHVVTEHLGCARARLVLRAALARRAGLTSTITMMVITCGQTPASGEPMPIMRESGRRARSTRSTRTSRTNLMYMNESADSHPTSPIPCIEYCITIGSTVSTSTMVMSLKQWPSLSSAR